MIKILQLSLFGTTNLEEKINRAIERIKTFEPPEGYYLAFSGGKDSQCIYHLTKEAGVKFDTHYNHTTVDPPELIYFIRDNYPDVISEKPPLTMWQLIVKKRLPPTRKVRYCCQVLKENGGIGRFCMTGVRWSESTRRANTRSAIEIQNKNEKLRMLFNDNDDARRMIENCTLKGKQVLNPIIDWTDDDVWNYIKSRNLKYCKLYDEGFTRLGCIGCPMAGQAGREREFIRWPKYKKAYLRTFDKLATYRNENGLNKDKNGLFTTGQGIYNWWMEYIKFPSKEMDGQTIMQEFY